MGAHTAVALAIFFLIPTVRAADIPAAAGYDPLRSFKDPVGAQFAMVVQPDNMLRGGPAVRSSPICAWITGDTGEDKGRNYLEAGMSTELVLRKTARYPVIVTIPTTMAVGDEQYFFGPHFAYVSTGLNVRMPLSFVPSRYGAWTAGGRADICYFGTTALELAHLVAPQMPKLAAVLSVEF